MAYLKYKIIHSKQKFFLSNTWHRNMEFTLNIYGVPAAYILYIVNQLGASSHFEKIEKEAAVRFSST